MAIPRGGQVNGVNDPIDRIEARGMEGVLDTVKDLLGAKHTGEVLKRIAARARAALTRTTAAVYTIDPDGQCMYLAAADGLFAKELEGEVVQFGRGILGNIALAGVNEIVNDTSHDDRAIEIPNTPETEENEKLMAVSLRSGGRTIGVMAIWRDSDEPLFGQPDLEYLTNLGALAVLAIENARAYEEAHARIARLSSLAEIGRALATAHEQDALLQVVYEQISRVFDTTNFYIATYVEGSPVYSFRVHVEHGEIMPPNDRDAAIGLTGYILATREPLLMKDPEEKRKFHERTGIVSLGQPSKSWMGVPLIAGDEIMGVMAIQSYDHPGLYQEQDLEFFSLIGTEVAVAIQNARLFESSLGARNEAEEANRMKSAFLAKMSHELRTPLNAIINFAYILNMRTDGDLTDGQSEMLTRIEDAGRHLLGLINDVLDLAKIESGRMDLSVEECGLVELVGEVMRTAYVLVAGKPVKLSFDPGSSNPIVRVDRIRIHQVLLNLLSNASKFTSQGSITVSIETRPRDRFVTVKVADTGKGIEQDELEKIFDEFYQVEDAQKVGGTGLGLPISRHFVEMHGGTMSATSAPGKGSTFSFTLPLAQPPEDAIGEPPAAVAAMARSKPAASVAPTVPAVHEGPSASILVIDDDDDSRGYLMTCLHRGKYRVVQLQDSRASLQKTRDTRPDLIVLDVMMPNADGWSVLQALKQTADTRDIPVVICSVLRDARRAFYLDADDYLSKPYDAAELVKLVGKYARDGGTVLAIDDDPDSLEIVRRILDPVRIAVRTAGDGEAGLASIRAARPDVVVLDLMMPGKDGFEVLSELRADPATVSLPVIVVTAKELTREERALIGEHADAMLQKGSFKPEELEAVIERLLARGRQAG